MSVQAPEEPYHIPLCPTPHPIQNFYHTPTATISKPPPQEPETPEASTHVARNLNLAPEVSSLAASLALEVAIPAHMTPLCLQLGGIKTVDKCWVEGAVKGH